MGVAITLNAEQSLLINPIGNGLQFPLSVDIEPHGGEVFVVPLVRGDHGKQFAATDFIEVVDLADDGLEVYIRLVNEFVPVEMIDRGQVGLTNFGEFLLQLSFHLGNTARLERTEIGRNNPWAQG